MAPIAATIRPDPEAPAGGGIRWEAVGWLYAAQAANLLLPLASLPYLARVLGPEAWGKLAFAQSFGLILGLGVEYGFNYSATRAVALARDDRTRLGSVTREILAAQALLLSVAVLAAWVARPFLPQFAADPALLWASVIWMIPQAAGLQWYFQGTGAMPAFAWRGVAGRALGVAGVLLVVRDPGDAALALWIQAGASLAITVEVWWRVVRCSAGPWPTARGVRRALGEGQALFVYRTGVYLYAVLNTFALGFLGPAAQLGAYALAERLAKAAAALVDPLSQALFPQLVRNPESPANQVSVQVLAAVGAAAGAGLWFSADWLVLLTAGRPWPAAAESLRAFAPFPLGAALTLGWGVHRLLPAGRDWTLTAVVLMAAVLHGLALWGGVGLGGAPRAHVWLASVAAGVQFFQILMLRVARP